MIRPRRTHRPHPDGCPDAGPGRRRNLPPNQTLRPPRGHSGDHGHGEDRSRAIFKRRSAAGAMDFISKPVNSSRTARLGSPRPCSRSKEMDCRKEREVELRRSNEESATSAERSEGALRGLIPICASCKKIRNDGGFWQQLEEYLGEHSEAEFSHGLCQPCIKKLYPGVYQD